MLYEVENSCYVSRGPFFCYFHLILDALEGPPPSLSLLPWQPPLSPLELLARSRAIKKATAAFTEVVLLGRTSKKDDYPFFMHQTKLRNVPLGHGHAYVNFFM